MKTTTQYLAKILEEALDPTTLENVQDGLVSLIADLDEKIEGTTLSWGEERIARQKRAAVSALAERMLV